jgi:hypothetical protein
MCRRRAAEGAWWRHKRVDAHVMMLFIAWVGDDCIRPLHVILLRTIFFFLNFLFFLRLLILLRLLNIRLRIILLIDSAWVDCLNDVYLNWSHRPRSQIRIAMSVWSRNTRQWWRAIGITVYIQVVVIKPVYI